MNQRWAPWLGFLLGLSLSCLLALFFRENPLHVLKIVATSFMNSKYDLGLTLFYTTCLIFTGLAFSIPMRAGLFNIGSEGQLTISAIVAAATGALLPDIGFIGIFLIFTMTILTGMLSSWLIAFFKFYRKAHEVVVAIMLNFIFLALATWLTINHLQNPQSQNPETQLIKESYRLLKSDPLKNYFDQSPVSSFFLLALFSCAILYFFEKKTFFFQKVKSFGANPEAFDRFGFSQFGILSSVMLLSGVFSAFVGLTEVLGNTYQFKIGFSPAYGFLGIAVSLLARQHFLGIIVSAFLLAVLHKGASDLDLETQFLTRDFSRVLQAFIICSVAASYYIVTLKKKRASS